MGNLCTVGGNINWNCHYEESMAVPQKIKIELTCDPTIPFLDIYPKELKSGSRRDTCTSVFTAALFTVAKTWKQPKCSSTDDG